MKILIDTSNQQTLSVIPRSYPTTIDYTIVEEGNGRTLTGADMTTATVSGFLTFTDKFVLQQDKFYSIDVFDSSDDTLIFRDKIFCTNQTVTDYTINNGEYTEDTTKDNDYVIYGEDTTAPDDMTLTSVTEV